MSEAELRAEINRLDVKIVMLIILAREHGIDEAKIQDALGEPAE